MHFKIYTGVYCAVYAEEAHIGNKGDIIEDNVMQLHVNICRKGCKLYLACGLFVL